MDAGIVTTLSLQVVSLLVMVTLSWRLKKVLRQDIREVREGIKVVSAKLDAVLVNMAVTSPSPVVPPPPYPVSPPVGASSVTADTVAESG